MTTVEPVLLKGQKDPHLLPYKVTLARKLRDANLINFAYIVVSSTIVGLDLDSSAAIAFRWDAVVGIHTRMEPVNHPFLLFRLRIDGISHIRNLEKIEV